MIFILDLSKYQPDEDGNWTCLGHPEIVLSFSQVNDDICDCPDGSDEPGTAACSGNWFHCRNEGHIPGKLPSSRVNDGVCDYDVCCDGSDEAGLIESLKGTELEFKCENRCKQVHKEYIERIHEERRLLKEASGKRKELIKKATEQRAALKKEIDVKANKVAELKEKLYEKEAALQEVESRESQNKNHKKNTHAEAKPQIVVDAYDVLQKVADAHRKATDDVTKLNAEIERLSKIIETMKVEYNPNFNDPAVKQAIRSYEEYKVNSDEGNAGESSQDVPDVGSVQNVLIGLQDYRAPSAPQSTSLVASTKRKIVKFLEPVLLWLAENGVISYGFESTFGVDTSDYEEDSAELKIHKNIVKKAQDEVSELEKQLEEVQTLHDTEHGPNDILRSLKDTCVADNLGEYVYEFCFYGGAHQKSTKDNSRVDLGKFDNSSYDEAKKTLTLNFENGARCWSGPIRRASITLSCGTESKILQVTEPERCEYFIRGISPAACQEYREDTITTPKLLTVNDEL